MKFVHTKVRNGGIIILVKTPQYIIYFFYYPHSKIPSPKKTADRKAVFFLFFLGGAVPSCGGFGLAWCRGAVPSCGGFGLAWCTVGGGWFLRGSIIWRLTFGKGQLLRFHFDSFYSCYESVAKGRPCPLPPGFAVRANPL